VNVLAVDPGLATGIAVWMDGHFETMTLTGGLVGAMGFLDGTIRAPAWDAVAVETFTIGQQDRAMTKEGQSETIEIIGAVKWAVHSANERRRSPLDLAMQAPADARNFSTNDKLRVAGFETPSNPDHERSAARHLLLYLVRRGAIDPLGMLRSLERE
jgi:hypothetical protein